MVHNLKFDEKELTRIIHPNAEFNIKRQYVLREVAEREKITVSNQDIDNKLTEYSKQLDKPIEEVRKDFRSQEGTNYLRSVIQEEKVVYFLLENSNITEV